MKKYMIPTKKLNNGFEMPVLGLGTWLVGGDKLRNPNNDDLANVKGIKKAIEMGISHIDTAENYAEGHAEKLVGQAIKGFDRKKLFITSKVDKRNLAYNGLYLPVSKCENLSLPVNPCCENGQSTFFSYTIKIQPMFQFIFFFFLYPFYPREDSKFAHSASITSMRFRMPFRLNSKRLPSLSRCVS